MRTVIITILAVFASELVQSANILAVVPILATSHFITIQPVFIELARRGHNITVISAIKDQNLPPNYTHIAVDQLNPMSFFIKNASPENILKALKPQNFFLAIPYMWMKFQDYGDATFDSKPVKSFIRHDHTKFDLVICEEFAAFSAYYMLAYKYNAPLITFTPFGNAHFVNNYMGNPLSLHYVAHEFMSKMGKLNLWDRTTNVIYTIYDFLLRTYFFTPRQDAIAQKHFSHLPQPLPKLRDIEKNISLVLINSHFSMDPVKSLLPNIVEYGGIHIKEPKPLPKDLQEILDNAKDGAILFSMGSNMKSIYFPKDKVNELINAFSSLKQTVLWKWENDTLPGKPNNVIIRKWFPQNDLLAHPNLRLFITHGGLASTQETVFHGVPIVGIPFFADQHSNIARAVNLGYAEYIDFDETSALSIKLVLQKVLNEPKYRKRAKEISAILKDRPTTAMETAIFWIEYVIRHKGAYHLKTPSSYMTWYEYYLIDVVGIIILASILLLWIEYKILKLIIMKFSCTINELKCKKKTSDNKKYS